MNNRVANTQLNDKLASLLGKPRNVPAFKKQFAKSNAVDVQSWGKDGEDHINIWQAAETVLGKFLSHDTSHRFNHNVLGSFATLAGFWYYVQSSSHDDRFRVFTSYALRNLARSSGMGTVDNFRAIMMDACWQRIKQNPPIVELLRNNQLPMDCYFIHAKSLVRVRPVFFNWIVNGTMEIQNAIKENREPCFNFLMDNRKIGLYDSITPEYLKAAVANKEAPVFEGNDESSDFIKPSCEAEFAA